MTFLENKVENGFLRSFIANELNPWRFKVCTEKFFVLVVDVDKRETSKTRVALQLLVRPGLHFRIAPGNFKAAAREFPKSLEVRVDGSLRQSDDQVKISSVRMRQNPPLDYAPADTTCVPAGSLIMAPTTVYIDVACPWLFLFASRFLETVDAWIIVVDDRHF